MKNLCIKMALVILITSSLIIGYKEKNKESDLVEKVVINNVLYRSDRTLDRYEEEEIIEEEPVVEEVEPIVYEGLTLNELGLKIDNVLNSTLDGYGTTIASLALDKGVDIQ